MPVTTRRLRHRWVAVLVAVGVGLAFLTSESSAHADTIVQAGLTPNGVAVDGLGDVFIADPDNNRVVVYRPNGSGGYTQSVVDDTGLARPSGVAVDASGNVFIADTGNSRVVVDKPDSSGSYTQSVVDDTGLNQPFAVAVNGAGDVFIADTFHQRVVVDKPNGTGGYTQSVVDDTGLDYPQGVAVDASGDVFIADSDNSRVLVDKPNSTGGYTQSVVDHNGLMFPAGVTVNGAGDVFIANDNDRVLVDKPNGTGGYTQSVVDAAGLDYPQGVAVDASGDVFIADTDHHRVLVDKPNGTGGYTQSVVADTGLSHPGGVATGGSGDLYTTDAGNNRVLVDRPNGTGGYTQSVVDSGVSDPVGVSVDHSGDVFIADSGNNRVLVDRPNSTGGYTQSVVDDTGLSSPQGVAVDPSGDVFIADAGANRVLVDKPNSSGGYTQSVVDDTGLYYPQGVAVDGSGDVFIADSGNSRVLVDKPNSTGGYTQSVVDTGVSDPRGVAVDGPGDVFIADSGNNRVLVDKPNSTGGYTQSVVDDTGLSSPQGVAVDPSGDMFIADTGHNQVVEHSLTDPEAAFTTAERPGSVTVAFTDASTAVSPATITGWSWNFGDGSPVSTQQNPSHTYGSPGIFQVSLTVTDSSGRSSTVTRQVVVAVHASLTYPTLGQTGVSTIIPFRWTDIPAGQGYQLWIGTSLGAGNLLKSGLLSSATTSSYKVPALPTGVKLWARLYTEVAGSWANTEDISFTVSGNRIAFSYPAAGQQNVNTITPFSWNPAAGAQAYQLTIGTKPGVANLVNSGILASNVTSYREPALPTGQTLYAKIVAKINGSWSDYQAISFTAAVNPVAFTHPTQGQTALSTPATFAWSTTPTATGYQMWIGTRRGDGSLIKSGWLRPGTSSYPVPALPAGQTLYARIYTGIARGWGNYQDITFTTATATASTGPPTATANRAITKQLTALAADQPTPAWMRRLLRLEPDLH